MYYSIFYALTFIVFFGLSSFGYTLDKTPGHDKMDVMITQAVASKDVISYTYLRHMPEFCQKLQQSYKGLKNEARLEKLLNEQNYIEVLNHLWSELDAKKRLVWLEKNANLGHPILMFELGIEYLTNSPDLETYFMKSLPWIKAGCVRVMIDFECIPDKYKDPSVDYASLLLFSYDPSMVIMQKGFTQNDIINFYQQNQKEITDATKQIILQTVKPLLSLDSAKQMPSPAWLSPKANLKEYHEIRKKEAEKTIKELESN